MNKSGSLEHSSTQRAIEIAVPLLVFLGFIAWCLRILWPFVHLVVWGAILAIALYPLVGKLAGALGGRRKLAITAVVVAGLAILLVPVLMIVESLIDSTIAAAAGLEEGELVVPAPPMSVADWPVVGDRLHEMWMAASANLETFLQKYKAQAHELGAGVLSRLMSFGGGLLSFVLSLVVAGVLMVNAEGAARIFGALAKRLAGSAVRGDELLGLSVSIVRTVATGVLGVAFIQATVAGVGMLAFGIPAAGVIALLVLILAIAQLPPLLVLLPVALWFFGASDSQLAAWGFLVFGILVNLSDLVLKPLLLGRGVDVPMLVVLLGAIGGLINAGIIGLFVGAVVLTLGYRLFMIWLSLHEGGEDIEGLEAEAEG